MRRMHVVVRGLEDGDQRLGQKFNLRHGISSFSILLLL